MGSEPKARTTTSVRRPIGRQMICSLPRSHGPAWSPTRAPSDRNERVARFDQGARSPGGPSEEFEEVQTSLPDAREASPPRSRSLPLRAICGSDLLDEDEERELEQGRGETLKGELDEVVPLPTWRFWGPLKLQDATSRRLLLLLRFDRRTRVIAKDVGEAEGPSAPPKKRRMRGGSTG
jgi:hypothetical protein